MTGSSDAPTPSAPAPPSGGGTGHFGWATGRASGHANTSASAPVPVSVDSLFTSAAKQAQRGLRARHDGDHDDAAFHLGTMIEHLLKAVLINLSPVLIYDKNPDFHSMLKLVGQGQRTKPDHVLRTVGFDEALARTAQVLYPLGSAGTAWMKIYKAIPAARNDAAHLGESPADPEQIAQLAVACASDLLPQIGRQLDDLFGGYIATARSLIEANTTDMERAVWLAVDTARAEFGHKYGAIPSDRTEEILALIDVRALVVTDDARTTAKCPACARTAIISGFPFLDYPIGVNVTQYMSDSELYLMLSTERLDCPTCHLRLHSPFELYIVGLSDAIDMRPATSQDRESYLDLSELWSPVDDDDLADDSGDPADL